MASVNAVFKDEAYVVDWHKAQIGNVIPHSGNIIKTKGQFTLFSETNILSTIDKRTGEVIWRQFFQNIDSGVLRAIETPEGTVERVILGLTDISGKHTVQLRNRGNGTLVWSNTDTGKIVDLHVLSDSNVVIVLEDGQIIKYNSSNGKAKWTYQLDSSHVDSASIIELINDYVVSVIYEAAGNKLKLISLDASNGEVSSQKTLGRGNIVGTSRSTKTIAINESSKIKLFLLDDEGRVLTTTQAEVKEEFDNVTLISTETTIGLVFDQGVSSWAYIYDVTEFAINYSFDIPITRHFSVGTFDDYYVTIAENLIKVFSTTSKSDFIDAKSYYSNYNGVANYIVVNNVQELIGDDQVGTKLSILAQFEDGVISFISNEKEVWKKEESLSNIISSTIIDYKEIDSGLSEEEFDFEETASLASSYKYRLTKHFNLIQDFISSIPTFVQDIYTDNLKTSQSKNEFFGFKKIFITATSKRKILALDTNSQGNIIWTLNVNFDIVGVESLATKDGNYVYVIATTGEVEKINGLSGEVVDNTNFSKQFVRTINDPSIGIAAWTEDNELVVVSPSSESKNIAYFYHLTSDKLLEGIRYTLSGTSNTWSFEVSEDEKIVAVSSKDQRDISASIAKVLGDRTVLYKYLYPNLISLAVVNEKTFSLAVYILDSVTGRVLYHTLHSDELVDPSKKVNILFGEHWVVYTYFSDLPAIGSKVVVLDLYESTTPNVRYSKQDEIVSSANGYPLPHVIQQAYYAPADIVSLGVTRTKFGVTSRGVLVTLSTGQIVLVPKRILDARRPDLKDPRTGESRKLSQKETEEGLIPYESILGIDPQAVISHQRQIIIGNSGEHKVLAIPTDLESTSVIISYANDVFGSRVTPSLPFDVLGESFGKLKLILTILALAIGVVVSTPMVKSRKLQSAWIIEDKS